jgi:hypothetical protein
VNLHWCLACGASGRRGQGNKIKPQAASRKPQAASRKPQAASRKPQATSHKPQAASRQKSSRQAGKPRQAAKIKPASRKNQAGKPASRGKPQKSSRQAGKPRQAAKIKPAALGQLSQTAPNFSDEIWLRLARICQEFPASQQNHADELQKFGAIWDSCPKLSHTVPNCPKLF